MDKNISFEEALVKLEDIVRRLEGGGATLDESLGYYEEAIALVKLCNERLDNAEAKIRILTEDTDGSITDAPFKSENET